MRERGREGERERERLFVCVCVRVASCGLLERARARSRYSLAVVLSSFLSSCSSARSDRLHGTFFFCRGEKSLEDLAKLAKFDLKAVKL